MSVAAESAATPVAGGGDVAFRETFGSRFGALMAMIGAAVGLGNVWRFPYMVGKFGGAAFVLFYVAVVLVIGVPALATEWALGRATRRGTVGAFERGGLPLGRQVGWFFFLVVTAATAYYTDVLGWVLYYAAGQAAGALGIDLHASAVLPPETGFSARAFALQLGCTTLVILSCVAVLLRGLRGGIERASKVIMPTLFAILLVLVARSLTLPGAGAGLRWYILKFQISDLTPRVMVAALGQAVFSLSLGGTFMLVYGSYLSGKERLVRDAAWTAGADTLAGLLAGLAIFPALFAVGGEPGSGPALIFSTLPAVFARIPAGWAFGLLFFAGLFGAAYLSDVPAFEVLIAGLTDNTRLTRRKATWLVAAAVLVLSLPPMISLRVFVPWDLTFGSGMQTLGSLLAVLTVGWAMHRSRALAALADGEGGAADRRAVRALYLWVRYAIPGAIVAVGLWWLATDVLKLSAGV